MSDFKRVFKKTPKPVDLEVSSNDTSEEDLAPVNLEEDSSIGTPNQHTEFFQQLVSLVTNQCRKCIIIKMINGFFEVSYPGVYEPNTKKLAISRVPFAGIKEYDSYVHFDNRINSGLGSELVDQLNPIFKKQRLEFRGTLVFFNNSNFTINVYRSYDMTALSNHLKTQFPADVFNLEKMLNCNSKVFEELKIHVKDDFPKTKKQGTESNKLVSDKLPYSPKANDFPNIGGKSSMVPTVIPTWLAHSSTTNPLAIAQPLPDREENTTTKICFIENKGVVRKTETVVTITSYELLEPDNCYVVDNDREHCLFKSNGKIVYARGKDKIPVSEATEIMFNPDA